MMMKKSPSETPHPSLLTSSLENFSSFWEVVIDENQKNLLMIMEETDKNHPLISDTIESSSFPFASKGVSVFDPDIMTDVLQKTFEKMIENPGPFIQLQQHHLQQVKAIVEEIQHKVCGEELEPLLSPIGKDKRFQNDIWKQNPAFFFMQQLYLLNTELLRDMLSRIKGLDEQTYKKLSFYVNQLIDAASPTNFPLTNPDVIQAIHDTKGQNLIQGFQNFLRDTAQGEFQIQMTDMNALKLKADIATTPGKVVFRNDLFELIQYAPQGEKVYQIPLLIIPPWINKFYIFDLKPENSFVRWLVSQGFTVFIMSWINPDKHHAQKTLTDYALEGAKIAVDTVRSLTKQKKINAIGYCTGGVLLTCLTAYLKKRGDQSIQVATVIAAPVDFKEAGDLSVYVCEEQLKKLEKYVSKKGYLEGNAMINSFNLLRANDLIWSFYINNYLLGKDPIPFDMLHWNADAVRMPAKMHIQFLRDMYLYNRLIQPGGVKIGGIPIDLKNIDIPLFVLAAMEDHIAPWKAVYPLTTTIRSPHKFILSGSGHVAGIFNPPSKNKYYFYERKQENVSKRDPLTAEEWLESSTKILGSWWPAWKEWIEPFSGKWIKALEPQSSENLGDAPGQYVLSSGIK